MRFQPRAKWIFLVVLLVLGYVLFILLNACPWCGVPQKNAAKGELGGGVNTGLNLETPTVRATRDIVMLRYVPGHLQFSYPVAFAKSLPLTAREIALASKFESKYQVCVSRGDFVDNSDFLEPVKGQIIRYVGPDVFDAGLVVMCDKGTELAKDLSRSNFAQRSRGWQLDCSCQSTDKTCCLVVIVSHERGSDTVPVRDG